MARETIGLLFPGERTSACGPARRSRTHSLDYFAHIAAAGREPDRLCLRFGMGAGMAPRLRVLSKGAALPRASGGTAGHAADPRSRQFPRLFGAAARRNRRKLTAWRAVA